MKYHIVCDGKRIASFLHASDRNVALSALQERHEDAVFEAEDT
jgi:hypothetical protein